MAKRTDGRSGRITGVSALGLLGAGALGFWLGRGAPLSSAHAAPPDAAPPAATTPSDYAQRVVAYIHGSMPITREDLGEYLIARYGTDKLELMVNRRIIEVACQKHGIDVTEAEVEAALESDLKGLNVNRKEFVDRVLKQYGKTLYEWKEDTIKVKLMMEKLCKGGIKVADEDLQKAFQSYYGAKVDCRIIIWPKGEERVALQEYDSVRKSEEGFDRKARSQAISSLAATGGKIKPIAHYAGVHPEVEKEAFALKPGEVSRLIATPEGTVCLRCDGLVPADPSKKLDEVREALTKDVYERKLNQEIPNLFKTLRDEAKPVFILKKSTSAQELEREVQQELQQTSGQAPVKK